MTTIEQEYTRLKALADAATPGPWSVFDADGSIGTVEAGDGAMVAQAQMCGTMRAPNHERRRGNAAFIASAHDMMALIERLMAERRAEGTK